MIDYAKQKSVTPPSVPIPVKVMLNAEPEPLDIWPKKAAPVIANAVYNAVGVRIKDLPFSKEKVLEGIKKTQKVLTKL